MDHNDIRHKLSEYLDDAVSTNEKTEIEKHLESCEQCGAALSELRKTVEHIKTVEEVEPPAWMTQKIMANVRAAAEEKKSWSQRLFFPLPGRLPLQTVAVVFLAIAAYTIYQTMQPAPKYSEAPSEQFSPERRAVSPALKSPEPARQKSVQDKPAQEVDASSPATEAPQAPRYKALDMKPEYEKPALTEPTEEIQGMRATGMEKRAETPLGNAPKIVQEQAPTATADALQAGPERESMHPSQKAKASLSAVKSPDCLSYEPTIVELSGIIKRVDFPSLPDDEKIAKGDKRGTYWILTLDKAVCVTSDRDNRINKPEYRTTEVQLALSSENYKKYRSLLAKPVTVTGTLFHASTGHHHTPVLLKADTVTMSTR